MFKGLHCSLAFSERAAVQRLAHVLCVARHYDILDSNLCIGNWLVFSLDGMKYVRNETNEFLVGGLERKTGRESRKAGNKVR
jgi:hypothetical protein